MALKRTVVAIERASKSNLFVAGYIIMRIIIISSSPSFLSDFLFLPGSSKSSSPQSSVLSNTPPHNSICLHDIFLFLFLLGGAAAGASRSLVFTTQSRKGKYQKPESESESELGPEGHELERGCGGQDILRRC